MLNRPCEHPPTFFPLAVYQLTNRNPKLMLYISGLGGFGCGFGFGSAIRNFGQQTRFRFPIPKPKPQSETSNPLIYNEGFGFRLVTPKLGLEEEGS